MIRWIYVDILSIEDVCYSNARCTNVIHSRYAMNGGIKECVCCSDNYICRPLSTVVLLFIWRHMSIMVSQTIDNSIVVQQLIQTDNKSNEFLIVRLMVREIHRWTVDSLPKEKEVREMFPYHDAVRIFKFGFFIYASDLEFPCRKTPHTSPCEENNLPVPHASFPSFEIWYP